MYEDHLDTDHCRALRQDDRNIPLQLDCSGTVCDDDQPGMGTDLQQLCTVAANIHSALFSIAAYTVILCFALFKTGSISKSIKEIHGHDHSNIEAYREGCKHLNLAANECDYTPVSLRKLIKDGVLLDIQGIHRMTIDRVSEKKE